MKTKICFAAALSLLLPSCTHTPAITGELISKDGVIKVRPDGRVEIIVEPHTSK
jgi:hypothetical protein